MKQKELNEKLLELEARKAEKRELLGSQENEKETLTKEKSEKEEVLTGLQSKEKQLKADLEKKKKDAEMERKENPPKIEITIPKNAEISEQDAKSLELTTDSGAAKKSVTDWLAQQEKDGWKLEKTVDTKEIGEYVLTKNDMELKVSFVDPGFIPGSITIRVSGDFKLEVKK